MPWEAALEKAKKDKEKKKKKESKEKKKMTPKFQSNYTSFHK